MNIPAGSGPVRLRRMMRKDLPEVIAIEHQSFSNPWPDATFEGEIQNIGLSYPVVAVDVSLSMQTPDVKPNRLERAKSSLSLLLDQMKGDRVGVVAFAGDAQVVCPLTSDVDAAKELLGALEVGLRSCRQAACRGVSDDALRPDPR